MRFTLSPRRTDWSWVGDKAMDYWCPLDRTWSSSACTCSQEFDCSVVTAVLDRPDGFTKALRSLREQSPSLSIQHVVVDGSSTRSHKDRIAAISPWHAVYAWGLDESLYDAFNLGWRLSRGKYVAYLNSDDWYEPDFLACAVSALEESGADWVFGDVTLHDPSGIDHVITGQPTYFMNAWSNFSRFHHTTVVVKRQVFEVVGDFPETLEVVARQRHFRFQLPYCADYAWFSQAQQAQFQGVWTPAIMGHMATGGASASDPRGTEKVYLEACAISMTIFPEGRVVAPSVWLFRYINTKFASKNLWASRAAAVSYKILRRPYQKMLLAKGR